MSRVSVSSLASPSGGAIVVNDKLFSPGMVVQIIYARSDARTSYSAAVTGDGTTMTDLNLTITPKFATSMLIMQWMINGEASTALWDVSFLVHKNGSLITQPGYESYNTQAGNIRWSGVTTGMYDNNSDSTMANMFIQYGIIAGSINTQTFAPAVRSSNSTAKNFLLNRCAGNAGADNFEVAISTGVIWEVSQ